MKKMFVVSLVLAAALAVGCSKKKPQTTPTNGGDSKTEMKKDDGSMGGATYGGAKTEPSSAPK
jgi:major membrane immunogen (membrane-anchored lipoprotein)